MAKKPFAMTDKELGDAFEERVASALKGRVQIGSGRIKVPTMRSDVLAVPFLIECKATKQSHITIKYDVWTDLLKKVKETPYLPSYAVSVVDQWGEFYDFVGIDTKLIPDNLLSQMCPNGRLQTFNVNKTKKVSCLIDCYKNRQLVEICFEYHNLLFIPLNRLSSQFRNLISNL
jgi:hypothetical protein